MEKLYSLSDLEIMSDGDDAFITTMKQIFEEEMLISIDKITQAFAAGDYNTIRVTAHTMKPSIDNLHILSIKEEIRQLEHGAARQAPLDELRPLAAKVESVLKEVIKDMKQPPTA